LGKKGVLGDKGNQKKVGCGETQVRRRRKAAERFTKGQSERIRREVRLAMEAADSKDGRCQEKTRKEQSCEYEAGVRRPF